MKLSFTHLYYKIILIVTLIITKGAYGQYSPGSFHTPVIDGSISSNEYGNAIEGQNQITNSGITTYLTWDATNLYVAISGVSVNETTILYFDKDNKHPGLNNGGVGGSLGDMINGVQLNLPFDADISIKAVAGSVSYSINNNGTWSPYTSTNTHYSDNGNLTNTGVKEFSIGWSSIGGKPGAFNFVSYNISSGGVIYNQTPIENPSGVGSPANFQYYYSVDSTTSGNCSYPFWPTKKSFSLLQSNNNAGTIDYYDFNANSSTTITRNIVSGGDWNIRNVFAIGSGRVDFGNSGGTYGNTSIDSLIISGGTFTTNGSSNDLNILGGIVMTGGTLTVSSFTPNFNIGTNFTKTGATAVLQTNNSSVNFNGNVQQVFNSSKSETFKFLKVANTHPLGVSITGSSLTVGTSGKSSFNISANSILKNDVIITIANGALGTIDGTVTNTTNGYFNIPNTSPNTATINMSSIGVYNHNRDGGAVPYFTWAPGSLCAVTGWLNGSAGSTLLQLDQSFSNFSWNCPGQTGVASLNNNMNVNDFVITSTGNAGMLDLSTTNPVTLNINGKFQIDGGKFNLATSNTQVNIKVTGNFIQNGGTINFDPGTINSGTITIKKDFIRTGGTLTSGPSQGLINIGDGSPLNQNINIALNTPPSSSVNFVIANSSNTSLQSDLICNSGSIKINGSLNCATYKISGTATFTLSSGATLKSGSLDPLGTFMFTANNGCIQTSGLRNYSSTGYYEFNGTSTQYLGDFTTNLTPANQIAGLTINNSSPLNSTSGVYLTTPVNVISSLNLNKGKLYSTSSNILTVNNLSSSGSVSSFVDGPIKVIYPANQSPFPIKKTYPIGSGTTFLPITLSNITTGLSSPTIIFQAFNTNCNGSADLTMGSLSNSEYWSANLVSGNFNSATLQLQRGTDLGAYNLIGNSQTSNGTYSSYGTCTITNPVIQPNNDITSLGFFVLGLASSTPTINSIVAAPLTGIVTPNNSGYQGQTLTINGSNFLNTGMTVTIAGLTVPYSFISSSQINVIVPSGINLLSDFIIITNNSNNLFSKAVFNYNGYISTVNGKWSSANTWLGNIIPPDNETVTLLNNMVLNSTANPKNLIIVSGFSLTIDPLSNPSATLYINSNLNNMGTVSVNNNGYINFQNNASFNNNSASFIQNQNSVITFQGNGTILGTATFSSLVIQGAVSFSPNITIATAGYLQLNTNALISSNSPYYSSNSTLIYNTGNATYAPGLEWNSSTQNSPGCPYNISVGQNLTAIIDMNAGSKPAICFGNLTLNSQGGLQFGNSPQTFTVVGNFVMDVNTFLILSTTVGADLILKSDWTNKGIVTANNSSVIFNDKTKDQTIFCLNTTDLNNLTIDKGTFKFVIGKTSPIYNLTISKTITVASGIFDMNNDPVILLSNSNNTGNVASIDVSKASIVNSSSFQVQRYIPQKRAWVMLSVPVNGSQTIHDSWQESQTNTSTNVYNNTPGYGVEITGPQTGVGFDISPLNNTSMLYYNSTSNKWTPVAGTTNTLLNDHDAYMLFVRGSRAVNIADGLNALGSATTLRSTGSLIYGQQIKNINPLDNFTLFRNPYPSTIDFHQLNKTAGLGDKFIVWDPYLTGAYGVGAFVTFTWNGTSYSSVPTPASPLDQYIQSGQAFIVPGSGNSETITFDESDKIQANKTTIFSPMGDNIPEVRINLYSKNSNNSFTMADGCLAIYSDQFTNTIDKMDAQKISNFNENIGLQRDNSLLAIEARNSIMDTDVLNINLKATANHYNLQVGCKYLNKTGLTGHLIDNYLKTSTEINLNDTINYPFEISSDVLSADTLRFQIVFRQTSKNSNVILTGEKIVNDVALNWNIESEVGVKNYEILRSDNGSDFSPIASVSSKSDDGIKVSYSFLDKSVGSAANSYRIKINLQNGEIAFSNVWNLINNENDQIKIYPNPIDNGMINIHFPRFKKGIYKISLYSASGQLFFSNNFNENSLSSKIISIKAKIGRGKYFLSILSPDGTTVTKQVVY